MRIVRSIKQMFQVSQQQRLSNRRIGFVPTMGALHQGHLSLIRKARKENDKVIVSIFVNPVQFCPKEDFKRYPRPVKKDIACCQKEGVDFIFYPSAQDMYPQGYRTYVRVEGLSSMLCGRSRPGHFQGVTTVVAKLFNIVRPDIAYFGQKDAQQAMIIKRMVRDLNIAVEIKLMPTVREKDGLAMSSRNQYLNQEERKDADVLLRALNLAKDSVKAGVQDTVVIINQMRKMILAKKRVKIDYIAIVDADELTLVKKITDRCLIALAVWIGKTRLIDNVIINPKLKTRNTKQT